MTQYTNRRNDTELTQSIILLQPAEVLPTIDYDLNNATAVDAWIYSADPLFFSTVFGPALTSCPIRVICDWKHRSPWINLQQVYPHLTTKTWTTNRTMHDKTILLHGHHITYLITANMHRGSFLLARNRYARVRTRDLHQRLTEQFELDWLSSTRLPVRQLP